MFSGTPQEESETCAGTNEGTCANIKHLMSYRGKPQIYCCLLLPGAGNVCLKTPSFYYTEYPKDPNHPKYTKDLKVLNIQFILNTCQKDSKHPKYPKQSNTLKNPKDPKNPKYSIKSKDLKYQKESKDQKYPNICVHNNHVF